MGPCPRLGCRRSPYRPSLGLPHEREEPASALARGQAGEHQPRPHRSVRNLILAHPLIFIDSFLLNLEAAFEPQLWEGNSEPPQDPNHPCFPKVAPSGVGNAMI